MTTARWLLLLILIGLVANGFLQVLTLRALRSITSATAELSEGVGRDPARHSELRELSLSVAKLRMLVADGQRLNRRLFEQTEVKTRSPGAVGSGEVQAEAPEEDWALLELDQLTDEERRNLKIVGGPVGMLYVVQPDGNVGVVQLTGQGDRNNNEVRKAASRVFELSWTIEVVKRALLADLVAAGYAREFATHEEAWEVRGQDPNLYVLPGQGKFHLVDISESYDGEVGELVKEKGGLERWLEDQHDVMVGVMTISDIESEE